MKLIDKIRIEIEEMAARIPPLMPFESIDRLYYTKGFIDGLGSALDLIDKYKTEKEKK